MGEQYKMDGFYGIEWIGWFDWSLINEGGVQTLGVPWGYYPVAIIFYIH